VRKRGRTLKGEEEVRRNWSLVVWSLALACENANEF